MTEWKAAGYVFSILAIITVAILLYINRIKHLVLTYKHCSFDYAYNGDIDTLSDEYIAEECRFGECLSDAYLTHPDTSSVKMILRLGCKYVHHLDVDSNKLSKYKCLDSLLKYREQVFDPKIAWD